MPPVQDILKTSKVVAVLGLKPYHGQVSADIFNYLIDKGYTVYGVNPKYAGLSWSDRPIVSSVSEVPEPIDILDIFRASNHLDMHIDDILSARPRPKTVWFQQGIRNDEVAHTLMANGMDVIQDYCIAVAYSTHRNHIEL